MTGALRYFRFSAASSSASVGKGARPDGVRAFNVPDARIPNMELP